MSQSFTFLVFGATGGTGKHFTALALKKGHKVRALARTPSKMGITDPNLQVQQGSITDPVDLDTLVKGVDFVVLMLGDKEAQQHAKINTAFVQKLVPAMRRHGVKRFLYQAGGLSKPYNASLPLIFRIMRKGVSTYEGQHQDNEAVMKYLAEEAQDIEWIVHRAGIGGDGPSKGVLKRSETRISVGTFRDCAAYNFDALMDPTAIHTSDVSRYL